MYILSRITQLLKCDYKLYEMSYNNKQILHCFTHQMNIQWLDTYPVYFQSLILWSQCPHQVFPILGCDWTLSGNQHRLQLLLDSDSVNWNTSTQNHWEDVVNHEYNEYSSFKEVSSHVFARAFHWIHQYVSN